MRQQLWNYVLVSSSFTLTVTLALTFHLNLTSNIFSLSLTGCRQVIMSPLPQVCLQWLPLIFIFIIDKAKKYLPISHEFKIKKLSSQFTTATSVVQQ